MNLTRSKQVVKIGAVRQVHPIQGELAEVKDFLMKASGRLEVDIKNTAKWDENLSNRMRKVDEKIQSALESLIYLLAHR